MTDHALIHIEDLKVQAIIGCLDHERDQKQTLILSLTLEVDIRECSKSDELVQTINYAEVAEHVKAFVEKSNFRLLEALSSALGAEILKKFHPKSVHLTIRKPLAIKGLAKISIETFHKA